ncbi:MAG: iron-sulfur cluster-binding domain-containing protein [Proteobacteria bacterium]|nr:iron-sulfur cluster-binding domain-containing protein [Pseudomonadota bacterium]
MIKKISQWLSKALVNNSSFKGFFEPLIQLLFSGWNTTGYRAKVIKIREESRDVFSLVLKASKRWKGFKAGQHIEIVFQQNGANVSRIFSISSPPYLHKKQRLIELTIRIQSNGRITPWLPNALKIGEFVNISAAKGDFVIKNTTKPLLLIAGGSGITPFRSMIAQLMNKHHSSDIKLLYYGNKAKILFTDEFKSLKDKHKNLSISFIQSNISGRICLEHLQQHCADFNHRDIYICGPNKMIKTSEQLLLDNNVEIKNIHFEYFGPTPIKTLDIKSKGIVQFSQSLKNFATLPDMPKTLLEIAESLNLNPTTGCRMGICHQCICEKKQGVVYNTLTKAFSDTGNEEIQLCISLPVGDVNINL